MNLLEITLVCIFERSHRVTGELEKLVVSYISAGNAGIICEIFQSNSNGIDRGSRVEVLNDFL